MSEEIHVEFEVRSVPIMRETLNEMGYVFTETQKEILVVNRKYHNIVINGKTGEVSLDIENKKEVDLITQNYQTAWFKDNLIREGHQYTEEVVNGVVELYVSE